MKQIQEDISRKYVLVQSFNNLLKYKVSEFEKRTLRNNVKQYKSITDWRRNQLYMLKKCSNYAENIEYSDYFEWEEFVFGRKRIMVKKITKCITAEWLLHPLYDNTNVLKSVSRRYINREKIGIWTSDNEVYEASDYTLKIFAQFLLYLRTGDDAVLSQIQTDIFPTRINDILAVLIDIKCKNYLPSKLLEIYINVGKENGNE